MKFRNMSTRAAVIVRDEARGLSEVIPANATTELDGGFVDSAKDHPLLECEPFTDRKIDEPFEISSRKTKRPKSGEVAARNG